MIRSRARIAVVMRTAVAIAAAVLSVAAPCRGDDTLDFVIAGYNANKSKLQSGKGVAEYTYRRTELASGKVTVEHRRVNWFLSDGRVRFDDESLDLDPGVERFGGPVRQKHSFSPDLRLFYLDNPGGQREAYVNNPPAERIMFVRNITGYFDPRLFFNIDDDPLPEFLNNYAQLGAGWKVDKNGPVYRIEGGGETPAHDRWAIRVDVDSSKGFCVTHAEVGRSGVADSPFITLTADYSDEAHRSFVYFPTSYHLVSKTPKITEEVRATFTETAINVDIPGETFTFSGMGVPPETPVYSMLLDKRRPVVGYYGAPPRGSLDQLVQQAKAELAKPGSTQAGALLPTREDVTVPPSAASNAEPRVLPPEMGGHRTAASVWLWIAGAGVVAVGAWGFLKWKRG